METNSAFFVSELNRTTRLSYKLKAFLKVITLPGSNMAQQRTFRCRA